MEILKYSKSNSNDNIVMALGYFDSIHIGHKQLLDATNELAATFNAVPTSLLFTGAFKGEKNVFSLQERLLKLNIIGIKKVVVQELNSAFMQKSAIEFLNELTTFYNVKGFVVGEDFTFGYKGQGDVNLLKDFCKNNGIVVKILPLLKDEKGNKISSTAIKERLDDGDILAVNNYLGDNYFIKGLVTSGKKVGKTIGYPTANIVIDSEKYPLKQGVYYTLTIINGKLYDAITNVGTQPTFNGNNFVIETFINDFDGDLYGKYLTVYFINRIRDIVKFNSVDELKEQLNKDKRWLK